ncbi:Fc.00g091290.m01.CDS01 [Cosmosporella sp. VM-42]
MSILSQIKKIRHHSKEHSSKETEQKKEASVPYKHTPTHAASDAIGSAPPSWRSNDRTKIREENRKRSAMAAAHSHAHHMNMPDSPTMGSGLSDFYSSGDTTPTVSSTPQNFGSPHPAHAMYYGSEEAYSQPASIKGKEADRSYYDPLPISPPASKGGFSPLGSSRNSFSSQDILEMRTPRSMPPIERPSTNAGTPHRLHPSSRRTSDASIERLAFFNSMKASSPTSPSRDVGPPPSTRGFKSLPPIVRVPPIRFGNQVGSLSNPASPSFRDNASRHSSPHLAISRPDSFASLPSLTPTSTRYTTSTPATPTKTITVKKAEFTMLTPVTPRSPSLNFDFQLGEDSTFRPTPIYDDPRKSRSRRYEDQVIIDSSVGRLDFGLPRAGRDTTPSPLTPEHVVNAFPEPSSPPKPTHKTKSRTLSISKAGSKLLRKKRWSSSKTATTLVS